jgi:hypothetical protein
MRSYRLLLRILLIPSLGLALASALAMAPPPPPPAHVATAGTRTGLTHNSMSPNGLSAQALSVSSDVRALIASSPLNETTLGMLSSDGGIADPNTHELLRYIVSCALSGSQSLGNGDAGDALGGEVLLGELGICPDWANDPPGDDCLQLVSSCVLARVNAVKKRVIISVRGEPSAPGDVFGLSPEVTVETILRDKSSVASFAPCPPPTTPGNPTLDCGWTPGEVGRCVAGSTVTVLSSDPNTSLRVCKGLYGCNHAEPSPPAYTGWLNDAPGGKVAFTCPTNGPLVDPASASGPRYGYFSVMIAPANPAALPNLGVSAPAKYPASEAEVFTYREGAFYGDLFGSVVDPTTGSQSPPTAQLVGDMFACFSSEWSCGLAELTDRFCAGAGSAAAMLGNDPVNAACIGTTPGGVTIHAASFDCFGNIPQPCDQSAWCTDDDAGAPDASGSTELFYAGCSGPTASTTWPRPITVYLNHPWDLSADGECGLSAVGARQPMVPPQ